MTPTSPDPYTERHGREYTATVRFCIPVNATSEQIEEYVQFELGGGSCAETNPLLATSGLVRVEVEHIEATGCVRFTDWGSQVDGRRFGCERTEYVR